MLTTMVITALLAASAVAAPVRESGARTQDWETTIADDAEGSPAFRAMTTEESERPDALVLSLDRLPGECDTVLISMAVVGGEAHGLPGGLLSPDFLGEMQVDQHTPRDFDYRFLTDPQFNNVILVQLTQWDGDDDLLEELRNGSKWRFRLSVDEEKQSWRFSLMGVSTALDQTYQACAAHTSDEAPEDVPAQAGLAEEYSL